MCLFKKKVILPHPEELVNYDCTMENYNLDVIFQKWYDDYLVPVEYRDYWRNQIEIEVTDTLPYEAATWEVNGKRHLAVRPEWLNAGVIAHEQAHNSYALLTECEKLAFADLHTKLKKSNEMVKYLYSINSYGLHNDIEGHAEIYRYLGQGMPQELKQYYPKLF